MLYANANAAIRQLGGKRGSVKSERGRIEDAKPRLDGRVVTRAASDPSNSDLDCI